MDLTAAAELRAEPSVVREAVADLTTYPRWLRIVLAAVPDGDGAWRVDIGAKVGPFQRAKRLRMVRTEDGPSTIAFERREVDDRPHSPWVLEATVEPSTGGGTHLGMHLHYGGSAWLPLLDRILAEEVKRAPSRLDGYLSAR